ncbi:MAG TPA: hypothetical protein VJP45_00480 [Candidatus Limnocylindria bacterium]|nr:hypothetical protein [Candidatus Limnocylindria bacterium]
MTIKVERSWRGLRYRFEVSLLRVGFRLVATNLDAGGEVEYRGGDGRWQRFVRDRRRGASTTDYVLDRELVTLLDSVAADAKAQEEASIS